MSEPVLQVKGLKTYYYTEEGVVPAVDGLDFEVEPGETFAIVGESGCGKSVTSLSILRLIPSPPGKIIDGENSRCGAHCPFTGAAGARTDVCRGDDGGGRKPHAHSLAAHPAQHPFAHHRADDVHLRYGDYLRSVPELPWRGYSVTLSELGRDA